MSIQEILKNSTLVRDYTTFRTETLAKIENKRKLLQLATQGDDKSLHQVLDLLLKSETDYCSFSELLSMAFQANNEFLPKLPPYREATSCMKIFTKEYLVGLVQKELKDSIELLILDLGPTSELDDLIVFWSYLVSMLDLDPHVLGNNHKLTSIGFPSIAGAVTNPGETEKKFNFEFVRDFLATYVWHYMNMCPTFEVMICSSIVSSLCIGDIIDVFCDSAKSYPAIVYSSSYEQLQLLILATDSTISTFDRVNEEEGCLYVDANGYVVTYASFVRPIRVYQAMISGQNFLAVKEVWSIVLDYVKPCMHILV